MKKETALKALTEPRHPMQPLVQAVGDTVRFKRNKIVEFLLESCRKGRKADLNTIADMDFSQDDMTQFAQLIGYSVKGFNELSYVSDEDAKAANAKSIEQFGFTQGCRDNGCEIHTGVPRE